MYYGVDCLQHVPPTELLDELIRSAINIALLAELKNERNRLDLPVTGFGCAANKNRDS